MRLETRSSLLAAWVWCVGCGGATGGPKPVDVPVTVQTTERSCSAPLPGAIGVAPLKNDTKATVDLGGTDDLLMSAMSGSGCFDVVERDRLDLLVSEMRLCLDQGEWFDQTTCAKKGKLLGVSTLVVGSLTMFERDIQGADLALKIPGIGGVTAGRSYAAMQISLRAVDVETGRVRASTEVHAAVPSDEAGVDVAASGFTLRVAASSRTPTGDAVRSMLHSATKQLRDGLAR
jgi:curli biogenesis system outer membrane secretion channel CsgG